MDNPLDNDDIKAAQPAPKPAVAPDPVVVDTPIAEPAAEPKGRGQVKMRKKRFNPAWIVVSVIAVLFLAGVGVVMFAPDLFKAKVAEVETTTSAAPAGPLAPFVKGSIAHMTTFAQPLAMDNLAFVDRDKKPVHLADFKGQVVVLNFWATWCSPCRNEMPTLASLQTSYAGKALKVLPLSGDLDDKFTDVKSFIDVQEPLDVYVDSNLIPKTAKLGIQGLPATLVIDKQGREVARLDGSADWNTPEVKALMDKLLAE